MNNGMVDFILRSKSLVNSAIPSVFASKQTAC